MDKISGYVQFHRGTGGTSGIHTKVKGVVSAPQVPGPASGVCLVLVQSSLSSARGPSILLEGV